MGHTRVRHGICTHLAWLVESQAARAQGCMELAVRGSEGAMQHRHIRSDGAGRPVLLVCQSIVEEALGRKLHA